MESIVRLSFMTDQERTFVINVRRPRDVLADFIVDAAMDELITSEAVDTRGRGDLVGKISAYRIAQESIVFDV